MNLDSKYPQNEALVEHFEFLISQQWPLDFSEAHEITGVYWSLVLSSQL